MDDELKISGPPKRRTIRCPNCGSTNTAKILYGMLDLSEDLKKQLSAGHIVLGGCSIGVDSPIRYCNQCAEDY